ncbi:MAG TPA: YsnF/AvaK domain-containing protein [Bryobacteraceae bacterium]|nr:YsnF/AvaK domain-containing protein [Bryobacteraceae bacterium]
MSQQLRSFPLVLDTGERAELLATSRFLDDSSDRLIRLADGREVRVPREAVTVDKDGMFHLRSRVPEQSRVTEQSEETSAETVIPVIEEEFSIHKRELQSGKVRIHKKVDTREIPVEEVLRTNDVSIERVAVDRLIAEPVEPRYEGETLVLPVMEEVLVVEKRLLLREEIRITRRVQEHTERKTVPVRSEHIEVERVR